MKFYLLKFLSNFKSICEYILKYILMYIYMYAYTQTTRIKIHMQILLNALRLNSIIQCKLIRINSKHLVTATPEIKD